MLEQHVSIVAIYILLIKGPSWWKAICPLVEQPSANLEKTKCMAIAPQRPLFIIFFLMLKKFTCLHALELILLGTLSIKNLPV